jgi:Dihaem cytochrome c
MKNVHTTTALLALAASASLAQADSFRSVTPLPVYTQECASCHVAYPPGLLPATSWQRLMGRLSTHYGTDASLDPTMTAALAAWLGANAGTGKRAREEPAQDRITRSAWFVREHREVGAEAWRRPAIQSPSNCAACHPRADQGDFDEHRIRIPR